LKKTESNQPNTRDNLTTSQKKEITPRRDIRYKINIRAVSGQIKQELVTAFQQFILSTFPVEYSQNEGVILYVTTAITDRVEQYFAGTPITHDSIPILLVRHNPGTTLPTLPKDNYGNLVVIFFSGTSSFSLVIHDKYKEIMNSHLVRYGK